MARIVQRQELIYAREKCTELCSLVFGDVIASFGADAELLVAHGDFDRTELAIGKELVRLVSHHILAAQLFLNVMERVCQVLKLEGEESAAAGGFRQHLEIFIALVGAAAGEIGANGVNDNRGALGHIESFLAEHAALVVITVRNQDHGATDRKGIALLEQLVPIGEIDCIPQRRSATGTDHLDPVGQLVQITGEVLGEVRNLVKCQNKGPVTARTDDLLQKLNGGLLLKLKTVTDGVAGVNQQTHPQRQVCFRFKMRDLLGWKIVVQDLELVFFEIADELSMLVSHGEDQVYFVCMGAENRNLALIRGAYR